MKLLLLLCVLVIGHVALGAEDDLPNATLVVYNPNYPESESLAEYYAAKRAVPKDRLIALPCSNDEEIDRHEYDSAIAEPLRNHFQESQLWTIDKTAEQRVTANKVRYIVLLRGIPLKIRSQTDYPGDIPDHSKPIGVSNDKAVDSELALLVISATRSRDPWRTLTSGALSQLRIQTQTRV